MSEDVTLGQVLLTEYEVLKREQSERIKSRDNLLYATLIVLGTVASVAITQTDVSFMLLVPPITTVLGIAYIATDHKISMIRSYIGGNLAPFLETVIESPKGSVFAWEVTHHDETARLQRKIIQLVANLLIFCILPFVALITFWVHGLSPWLAPSILEAIIVLAVGVEIVRRAELG